MTVIEQTSCISADRTHKRLWLIWWLACLAVSAVHISTLSFDSRINQDEVQIVDFGRATLQSDEPWAMSWNIQEQMPVQITSYLGPVIQELAFRLTAPGDRGIMLSSLLGALLAATFVLCWLVARKVPAGVSLALALAFLVDPAFSITNRDGRVDGWAMAAVLAACWLLRLAETASLKDVKRNWLVFFAGIASAVSVFIWPTTLMLAPLVLLEFVLLLRSRVRCVNLGWLQVSLPLIACFALGGAIAAGILLIPIFINWEMYLEGLKTSAAIQSRASVIQSPIVHLIAVHSPIVALVALSALLIKREFGLLLALAVAVALAWQTMIYPARLVYFLPYLLAMIGGAAQILWHKQPVGIGKAVLTRLLAMMLVWNASIVLVIRPFVSFQQRSASDSGELITELDRVIGEGQHRVLVGEWAPYFAGRALGWKIFREGSPVDIVSYEEFLLTMDYIIVAKKPLYPTLSDRLQSEKFEFLEQIDFKFQEGKLMDWGVAKLPIPEKGYKSILVYRPVAHSEVHRK